MIEAGIAVNGLLPDVYAHESVHKTTTPYKIVISQETVRLPQAIQENIKTILSGSTSRKSIARQRFVEPETIKRQAYQLRDCAAKISNVCELETKKSIPSTIEAFMILFKAGALVQVPQFAEEKTVYFGGWFRINLPQIDGRSILPYDLKIVDTKKQLSLRQKTVLEVLLSGKTSNEEIAEETCLSRETIKKVFSATPNSKNSAFSFRKLLDGQFKRGKNVGRLEIILKLIEFGIIRTVPIEFNSQMVDNNSQNDRL